MSAYALVLAASLAFPLLLSFDRKVAFWRRWPRALAAAAIAAPAFLAWDAWAAARGDWGFAPERVWPARLFGLPLEEILFFALVPFCCLFVRACLDAWFPDRRFALRRRWPLLAALLFALAAAAAWPRGYTATLCILAAAACLLAAGPGLRALSSRNFWLTQALCLVPFLAVNGVLTALPVVVYAPSAILGPRLGSIPVEDLLYSLVLVGAGQALFAALGRRAVDPAARGRAVVVGAGLAGLAAAARLARRGWRVTVVEAAAEPGGKAAEWASGGYRFDSGPSLLTMADSFDELFAHCGENRADSLEFVPLPEICRYFWPDGARFASRPAAAMPAALAEAFGEDPARVAAYFDRARAAYEGAGELFLGRSLHDWRSYLSRAGLRGVASLPRLGLGRTLHELHCEHFRDPRSVQLFDRLATYNGSDPYRAPAVFAIIAHSEYGLGAYAVRGGIAAVPRRIEALARRQGAEFRYGEPALAIERSADGVRGVRVSRGLLPAELVVSGADVARTYRELLGDPGDPLYRRQLGREPSSSGLVFLWGMADPFPELGVNNIFFSRDYRLDFQAIFDELRCPDDPTVYVNITSKVDAADAPPGCSNWFVLVNAPRDAGQDWAAETARVRAAVLAKLGAALGRDLAALVRCERVLGPADLAARGDRGGSLYGIASNQAAAAFFRHPNRHPAVEGLYFCGGSAHPGGGMPLALRSARIACELAERRARPAP